MKKITLRSIQHKYQRYETVGDWIVKHGKLSQILVSEMGNDDYEFLVAIHEAIEAWLCLKRGITQSDVDRFDMAFEKHRKPGDESEPGDSTLAPYRREHRFATKIERMLAKELGVDWKAYDRTVMELSK